jgi:hypothetical protein
MSYGKHEPDCLTRRAGTDWRYLCTCGLTDEQLTSALLSDVRNVALRLEPAEDEVARLRTRRNRLMFEAMRFGATERAAAEAAGVSPSYAHRVRVGKGEPASGGSPALEDNDR